MGDILDSVLEELDQYGLDVEEPRSVQVHETVPERLTLLRNGVTPYTATACYNQIGDEINVYEYNMDETDPDAFHEVLGHELIHKWYRDTFMDDRQGILRYFSRQHPSDIGEAMAQFYTAYRMGRLDTEEGREQHLDYVSEYGSYTEDTVDHLEAAFTVYDSFDLPPEDAVRETFGYFGYRIEHAFDDYDHRPSSDNLRQMNPFYATATMINGGAAVYQATAGNRIGAVTSGVLAGMVGALTYFTSFSE